MNLEEAGKRQLEEARNYRTKDRPEWFLDCFCLNALAGNKFPVSTYYHADLTVVMDKAREVLTHPNSGIDFIKISHQTLGMAPIQLGTEPKPKRYL